MRKQIGFLVTILIVTLQFGLTPQARAQDDLSKTAIAIPNHSFESGNFTNTFTVSPGMNQTDTFVVNSGSDSGAPDGRFYAKLTRGTGDAFVATEWIETGADVTGKAFTFTFDIKSHNANTPIGSLLIQRYPLNGDWSDSGAYTASMSATPNWQTKAATVTFTRPRNGNTSSKIRIVLRPTHESAPYIQPIYYDNLRLNEGPSNLTCGATCSANSQCADGLTCYQPMIYAEPAWQDVTPDFAELGTGEITSHDIYITAQGTKIESVVNNGVLFSRYGEDQPWRVIDFKCIGEANATTCCEMEGACGVGITVDPNDTLLAFNIFENSSSQVTIHITRQISGVYSKTMSPTDLGETFITKLRASEGWIKQTEIAKLNELEGDNYLSFSMAYDRKGNAVQHIVKYDFSTVAVVNVFQRFNWLNRGWSEWSPVYDSRLKDIKRDFGDTLPGSYPIMVDPYYSNNQHQNYLIRATVSLIDDVYKITNSHLYKMDPAKITYAAGQCRGVFTPSFSCDSTLANPTNLQVAFVCSQKQAKITWTKASGGSLPNVYEIAMCKAGECTTDEDWNDNIIAKIQHKDPAEYIHASENYVKGDQYSYRIRSAYFEGETRTQASAWSEALTKTMAGPLGDMDADCDVDLTDYTTYVTALHSPYAPQELFVRLIYFFNALIANMGTSN
jgi:hypothetical protein